MNASRPFSYSPAAKGFPSFSGANYALHSRVLVACLVSVVLVGCGPPKPSEEVSVNSGHDPNDKRTMAFVSWLKQKGVTLEYARNPGDGGPWRVTQPKISAEYDVVFSIRAFPSGASEKQMRDALNVNLAYVLNTKAHLAMSYAGYQGRYPEDMARCALVLSK